MTTLSSVPKTQTSIYLPLCLLRTRSRPSVWCNLNLDSSMEIQCPKHDDILYTDGGTDDVLKSVYGIEPVCEIVWILQNTDQKFVSTDGIRVNLTPSMSSADLPHWLLTNHLLIQSYMKCIRRVIYCRNPFRQLPVIGAIYASTSISQPIQSILQSVKLKSLSKKKYSDELADSVWYNIYWKTDMGSANFVYVCVIVC